MWNVACLIPCCKLFLKPFFSHRKEKVKTDNSVKPCNNRLRCCSSPEKIISLPLPPPLETILRSLRRRDREMCAVSAKSERWGERRETKKTKHLLIRHTFISVSDRCSMLDCLFWEIGREGKLGKIRRRNFQARHFTFQYKSGVKEISCFEKRKHIFFSSQLPCNPLSPAHATIKLSLSSKKSSLPSPKLFLSEQAGRASATQLRVERGP